VMRVAIAPDGTWLATASEDRTARIWAATGTSGATRPGPAESVPIAPDGSLASGSGDGTTWAAYATPRATLRHRHVVWAVAIAPDGTWLATASVDKTMRTWAADGTPRATLAGHKHGVGAVAIAPDGTWLATGDVAAVRIWAAAQVPAPQTGPS
jgi:WD40 repeat protein